MIDIWLTMKHGGVTYFAQPDALKVTVLWVFIFFINLLYQKEFVSGELGFSYIFYLLPLPGVTSKHFERGKTNSLHGCSSGMGKNARENEGCWGQVFNDQAQGSHLGKRRGPRNQPKENEWVSNCFFFFFPLMVCFFTPAYV